MPRSPLVDHKPGAAKAIPPVDVPSGRNVVSRVSALDGSRLTTDRRDVLRKMYETSEDVKGRPVYMYAVPPWRKGREPQRISLAERVTQAIPSRYGRDSFRVFTHGLAETGVLALKTLDIPSRLFGHERSRLRDWYEKIEAGVARDKFETDNAFFPIASTAVNLASAGVYGKALAPMFGANVGVDTYELAKETGAQEGGALATGTAHGLIDMAIWTLGQGLASRYLPKAWQWLGRELAGAMRGAASSVTSDTVLNSLGADISGEEMTKHAVHAAWMVPVLGMLKMGGKRRAEAMSLLKKARPDLAGMKADKVIETIESEFGDPKSQKVALAWVARKGANLPDDVAQIRQALEVASKVKGLDPMSRSPFEILSDPAYARYLPKPRPQDVKAFSNMKRYPMGVIGFDVSDDAAGRQATREMINAYMSPSSNPWCLATGKDAAKLGELGPGAEGYWKQHSAVPKQIFFQEVDGKLELTAFRATSSGGEGRQEYWDTSDAGYSGIPIKVKVPGDPMGRYRKMVFRPGAKSPTRKEIARLHDYAMARYPENPTVARLREFLPFHLRGLPTERVAREFPTAFDEARQNYAEARREMLQLPESIPSASGEVQGTFEDIAPGKVFKGDPFRDGRSQTWVLVQPGAQGRIGPTNHESTARQRLSDLETMLREGRRPMTRGDDPWYNDMTGVRFVELTDGDRAVMQKEIADLKANLDALDKGSYVLVEDKERTTENGITKFRTTKYADPTDWDYEPPKPGEQPKPVEIEESELVSPEWMRARGYDPESESDVRRMQSDLNIQAWGNGAEAAMAVVPTKRTYMQTKSGTPETVTYGPNGRDVVSVDFEENGVPYRYEHFWSDEHGHIPDALYSSRGLGIDEQTLVRPTVETSSMDVDGYRVVKNPDGQLPEIVESISWDEGLGGYVRTFGNKRWYIPEKERVRAARERDAYHAWMDDPRARASGAPMPEINPPRIMAEVRQPDGTWAPAVDRVVNAETGETVELPPPPPAARMNDVPSALKAAPPRSTARAAEGGADAGSETAVSEPPVSETPTQQGGPRIVVNPQVFRDKRDALCVAFNEAFRVVMEENGFEPVSEPTEKQRKFFADTAYANDELQLRRTILARIATLDTSVSDPTDEQLEETVEMLEMVMEVGAPQNEWEQQAVQRLHDVVAKAREGHVQNEEQPEAPQDEASTQADVGGGVTDEDKATAWEAGKRFDMGRGKYFLAGEKEGEGEIRWSADDSVAMGGVTGFKSWGKRGANSNFEYKTDTGSLRFETYDKDGEKLRTWNQSLARIDRKANDGHVIKAGEVVAETIQLHRPGYAKITDGSDELSDRASTSVESRNNVSGEVKEGHPFSRIYHPGLKYMRTWEPGARIDMGQGKFFLAGADKGTGAIYGADGSAIHRNVTDFSMTHVGDSGTDFNYVTDTGAHRTEHLMLPRSKNTSYIKSAIYSKSGDLLSESDVQTDGTYHRVQRQVHGTNLAMVTKRSVLDGTMEKPEVYTIDTTTGERLAAGGDGDSVGATAPNPAPSTLPQPAAPQPAAPQPAPSITPPAPGKSGNNLTGDAPSIVPDEPTDGVVAGPGGRKTYKDASGRRITRDAWRKLHGLA